MVLGDIGCLYRGDVYCGAAFCLSSTKILKLTTIGGTALYKQNLHTHTTYTDGKNAPEELIEVALARGFDSIGFSEHTLNVYSPALNQLTEEKTALYRKEIAALKEKYRGQIDIFCGLEYEFYSEVPQEGYDYLIGSVHYLECGGGIFGFDRGFDDTVAYVQNNFGGDGLRFAEKYFETLAHLPERGNFDIIGHFDLITKNNERGGFIDVSDKRYLNAGMEAIEALKGKIPLFEVNTGAIARNYRTQPYPQMEFLKEFKRQGFGATISSDCHNKDFLDCHFDESRELLLAAGFKSIWVLTDGGFKEMGI